MRQWRRGLASSRQPRHQSLHRRPHVTRGPGIGPTAAMVAGCVQVVARASRAAKAPLPGGDVGAQRQRGKRVRRPGNLAPTLLNANEDEILRLNVGGTIMHTARSTLLQVPGSVLHNMFCDENKHLLLRSNSGEVFLDADPHTFQQVLCFLREVKMRKGHPDTSLSSFREDERPHLALLLQHLRLISSSSIQQQQPQPDHSLSKRRKRQQQQQQAQLSQQQQQRPRQQQCASAVVDSTVTSRSSEANGSDSSGSSNSGQPACTTSSSHNPHQRELGRNNDSRCSGSNSIEPTAPSHTATARLPALLSIPSSAPGPPVADQPKLTTPPASPRAPAQQELASSAAAYSRSALQSRPPASTVLSLSQMYFVQAQCEQRGGMRISVYTESDLASVIPSERFEVFCNVSMLPNELSFTFVCRKDFDDVFLGITTRDHIDRKGASVPCFGWKANSRLCAEDDGRSARQLSTGHDHAEGASGVIDLPGLSQLSKARSPLWGRGDSVELIISLPSMAGKESGVHSETPTMVLKVNGQEIDRLSNLPDLSQWCWHMALELGGDVSCVSLMQDAYAVHWAEYQVKRFLS